MSRKHFLVAVTRSGRRNDEDGVVTTEGELRTFLSESEALTFATSAGLELGDESVTSYALDQVDAWSSAPAPGALPLDSLLEAWNLVADVANSSRATTRSSPGHCATGSPPLTLPSRPSATPSPTEGPAAGQVFLRRRPVVRRPSRPGFLPAST